MDDPLPHAVAARDAADPLRALPQADRGPAAWSASRLSPTPARISVCTSSTSISTLLHVASEIALRFYLTIGFVTWLGLAALAATSTDAMIRRLGPRWKRLHSIVYGLAVLALLHFMIQAKADVSEPVMMTGFFIILMLFRALTKRGLPAWGAALAAAIVSPPLAALIEASWYALVRHIPFWEVLGANIDPDMAFRPSAYVALGGAAFLVVALLRGAPATRRSALLAARPATSAGG